MEWLEYLEPHSLVRFLWRDAGLSIDEDLVREYWQEHRARGHAWAIETEASDDVIPLGLYGDGCRIRHVAHQPVQKCIGLFLNCPLFRPYGSRASRWLLFSIDENLLWGCRTLNTVLSHLTWSLNLLFHDEYPRVGQFGQPLSAEEEQLKGQRIVGKKFVVTELRGDWSWVKMLWRCRSSWKGGAKVPVCHLCSAYNTGPNKYYMVQESEAIWAEQFSLLDFLTKQMPSSHPCCLLATVWDTSRSEVHWCF